MDHNIPASNDEIEELLEVLTDVVGQACDTYDDKGGFSILDSQALSAYADGIRLLAKYGRVEITAEYGRRVIAKWVTP